MDEPLNSNGLPQRFEDVDWFEEPLEDGLAMEQSLLGIAASGASCARIWRSRPMMVVPRSYRKHPRFEAVQRQWARSGIPIAVRQSGGGAVPLEEGVLNLSLAWSTRLPALTHADAIYGALCDVVARSICCYGIECRTAAVQDSFCDGRFNLSIGGRKVAGTAQHWSRGGSGYVVMAHALLIVEADLQTLTERANALEFDLQSGRTYSSDALTSVAREINVIGRQQEGNRLLANVASSIREGLESGIPHASGDWQR
jgi:lipoate-protein ligase A